MTEFIEAVVSILSSERYNGIKVELTEGRVSISPRNPGFPKRFRGDDFLETIFLAGIARAKAISSTSKDKKR